MKNILKNWKTSLAGLISIVTAVLVGSGKITPETGVAIGTVTAGLGLAVAKDGDQKGVAQ